MTSSETVTVARVGLRSVLNSSSLICMFVMLTGITFFRPQTKRMIGGFLSSLKKAKLPRGPPSSAVASPPSTLCDFGATISSSVESCGEMPNCSVMPSPSLSRSVASSRMSKLMVSCLTVMVCPARRSEKSEPPSVRATCWMKLMFWLICRSAASQRCAVGSVPPTCAVRVRVMVIGLNWKTTNSGGRLSPNSTKAPRRIFGWLEKPPDGIAVFSLRAVVARPSELAEEGAVNLQRARARYRFVVHRLQRDVDGADAQVADAADAAQAAERRRHQALDVLEREARDRLGARGVGAAAARVGHPDFAELQFGRHLASAPSASLRKRWYGLNSDSPHSRPIFSYSRRAARTRCFMPMRPEFSAARKAALTTMLRMLPPATLSRVARKSKSMSSLTGAAAGKCCRQMR